MTKKWLRKKQETEMVEVMDAKIYLKPLTYGKSRQATTLAMKVDLQTQAVDIDANLLALLRVLYQIKDWDLTNENDEKLPITLEVFDELLDEDFVNELINEVNKVSDAITNEEKK